MKRVAATAARIVLVVLILVSLLVAGRALILKKKSALAQAPRYHAPASLVDAAAVRRGDLDEVHDYLAVVEPVESANVMARVTATIERVDVDEGDAVVQGQPLITLDRRQNDAQVQAVKAQIQQAQADLKGNQSTVTALEDSYTYWSREAQRDAALAGKGAIPGSQAEGTVDKRSEAEGRLLATRQKSASIEQQIKSLEARLDELMTTSSYYTLNSPYHGIVTSRLVDPGDQAAPGKPLIVIENAGALMVTFDVPQTDLPAVQPGLTVTFTVDGQTRNAPITRLYPSVNRARMVRAEVVLNDEQAVGLTSGEYLTATVAYRRHQNVSLIPLTALVEGGAKNGDTRVFVVGDGALHTRTVRVLGVACDQAAVEGVNEGEQVVTHSFLGWARLSEGMPVEVR